MGARPWRASVNPVTLTEFTLVCQHGGATTPTQIASLLGMDASSLTYHLNVMSDGGFVRHDQDLLLQRRPVITVADPVVKCVGDLERLRHIAELLAERGLDTSATEYAIFSRTGFTGQLASAGQAGETHLLGLAELYGRT